MSSPNLQNVATFLKVVEVRGFGAAARELGLTQSTVSRRVSELERKLGHKLIERTTRRLILTETGVRYREAVGALVAGLAEAEADLNDDDMGIQGPLRITIPSGYGRAVVLPSLVEFARRYPLVQIDVDLSDRYADLLSEGFDLALRLIEPKESGLQAKMIGRMNLVICATPEYLARNPINGPDALVSEQCLVQRTYAPRTVWQVSFRGITHPINIKPRMMLSEVEAIRDVALFGLGIAGLPEFLIIDELSSARLRQVHPDMSLSPRSVYMVWPRHKSKLPRLTALREHLELSLARASFGNAPSVVDGSGHSDADQITRRSTP